MAVIFSSDADRIIEEIRYGRINRRIATARLSAFRQPIRQAIVAATKMADEPPSASGQATRFSAGQREFESRRGYQRSNRGP